MDRNTHPMLSPFALALTVPAARLAWARGAREGPGITPGHFASNRQFNFARS